jgi:hypothetical protein
LSGVPFWRIDPFAGPSWGTAEAARRQEVVRADALSYEALAGQGRIRGLDADRRAGADAVEQLVAL